MGKESSQLSLSSQQRGEEPEFYSKSVIHQEKAISVTPSIFNFKRPKTGETCQESMQENTIPHHLVNVHSEPSNYGEQFTKDRRVSKMPFKVLDAPSLTDDFYLNLVDWSSSNLLAVGLEKAVYIWSAQDNKVTKLCEVDEDDAITSVNWS